MRVPDELIDDAAAVIEPASGVLHAVRRSRLRAGDVACIVGCGLRPRCHGFMLLATTISLHLRQPALRDSQLDVCSRDGVVGAQATSVSCIVVNRRRSCSGMSLFLSYLP